MIGKTLIEVHATRTILENIFPFDPNAEYPLDSGQGCITRLGQYDTLVDELARALTDNPPVSPVDGHFIAKGYSEELDEQLDLQDKAGPMVEELKEKYRSLTGITTLRVKRTDNMGYFFEVNPNSKVLAEKHGFIHCQTLTNAMRYKNKELYQLEDKINRAEKEAIRIELEIFEKLVQMVVAEGERIVETTTAIAALDVATSLAVLATQRGYSRPILIKNGVTSQNGQSQENVSSAILIEQGRHPIVEAAQADQRERAATFVSNDCVLSPKANVLLITGPNMGGKSTYLRQNALIVIMAQMGSFVPAQKAEIEIVDKIFCRVGASDDLANDRSTFMVEMVETANIISSATPSSLVIMDEIGRGTSTTDGLALAWSILEHLHDSNKSRTLFATHYHELTAIASKLSRVSCYTLAIQESKDDSDVIFSHKVIPGVASRSYGVLCAKLAGVPQRVIDRATQILKVLEKEEHRLAVHSIPHSVRASTKHTSSPVHSPVSHISTPPPSTPPTPQRTFTPPPPASKSSVPLPFSKTPNRPIVSRPAPSSAETPFPQIPYTSFPANLPNETFATTHNFEFIPTLPFDETDSFLDTPTNIIPPAPSYKPAAKPFARVPPPPSHSQQLSFSSGPSPASNPYTAPAAPLPSSLKQAPPSRPAYPPTVTLKSAPPSPSFPFAKSASPQSPSSFGKSAPPSPSFSFAKSASPTPPSSFAKPAPPSSFGNSPPFALKPPAQRIGTAPLPPAANHYSIAKPAFALKAPPTSPSQIKSPPIPQGNQPQLKAPPVPPSQFKAPPTTQPPQFKVPPTASPSQFKAPPTPPSQFKAPPTPPSQFKPTQPLKWQQSPPVQSSAPLTSPFAQRLPNPSEFIPVPPTYTTNQAIDSPPALKGYPIRTAPQTSVPTPPPKTSFFKPAPLSIPSIPPKAPVSSPNIPFAKPTPVTTLKLAPQKLVSTPPPQKLVSTTPSIPPSVPQARVSSPRASSPPIAIPQASPPSSPPIPTPAAQKRASARVSPPITSIPPSPSPPKPAPQKRAPRTSSPPSSPPSPTPPPAESAPAKVKKTRSASSK